MEFTTTNARVSASGHPPVTAATETGKWMISKSSLRRALRGLSLGAILSFSLSGCALVSGRAPHGVIDAQWKAGRWQIDTPIVGYYHGPGGGADRWGPLTHGMARKLVDGGFNLVWGSRIEDLDVAHAHGLRVLLLTKELIWAHATGPGAYDDPARWAQIESLIDSVKDHPALYNYYVADEPSAAVFPMLARVVAYIREHDPAHEAHINLFPSFASAVALGTAGDKETAYREHLRRYLEVVKPDLISWDHYPFRTTSDSITGDYFLNLALIREASLYSGVPFMNIIQAVSLRPELHIPTGAEGRFQAYTTLAYGGQGISHYTYWPYGDYRGGISGFDDIEFDEKRAAKDAAAPITPLGEALREIHPRFIAIAEELQTLTSLGVYHLGVIPQGGVGLPTTAAFTVDPAVPAGQKRGILLGYFGSAGKTGHVLVVNLDYTQDVTTTVVGPGPMEAFDAGARRWQSASVGRRAKVDLLAGGGKLVRLHATR